MNATTFPCVGAERFSVDDVVDYIILRAGMESDDNFDHLKLQKLLYYCQAWYLAFYGKSLFDGDFEAWVHGPVHRGTYSRFFDRTLYGKITGTDIKGSDPRETLSEKIADEVEAILGAYAHLNSSQLEILTHREKPWIEARRGCAPTERSRNLISRETMRDFYREIYERDTGKKLDDAAV